MKTQIALRIGTLAVLIWISCIKPSALCAQQPVLIDYYYILDEVEKGLKVGDQMALRNTALLLDKVSVKRQALDLLEKYTLFTPREFRLNKLTTKRSFLNFFYKNQEQLHFSLPLQAFYLTPLEERPLQYQVELVNDGQQSDPAVQLRAQIDLFEQAMEREDLANAQTSIKRIGQVSIPESESYLLNLIREKSFRRKYPQLTQATVIQLASRQKKETLQQLINLYKEGNIATPFFLSQLRELTNLSYPNVQVYERELERLGSVAAMRQAGYDRYYDFKPWYYTDTVNYYGKILFSSDTLEEVQQSALKDLVATKDARALYYLAIKAYRIAMKKDKSSLTPDMLYDKMQSLLAARAVITDEGGSYVAAPNWQEDEKATLNFAHYWVAHHKDYEWDQYRAKFINKTISFTFEKRYKRYIQQLTSTNDSVAWNAYVALTEGDPEEITRLTELFRPVLGNHNTSLPPIEYAYLERTAALTDFCRRNDVLYKPNSRIKIILDSLYTNLAPKDRHRLEKKLYTVTQLNDLTSLEYQATLYAAYQPLAYSIAWVLDQSYTKYWQAIFSNDKALRLYLKKTYLFKRLGVEGVCNIYDNKFDLASEKVKRRLNGLLALETDKDIIQQIELLLASREEVQLYTWKDLLEKEFSMSLLAAPKPGELSAIFGKINEIDDERNRLKLIFYLSLYPSTDQVRYLIKMLKDDTMEREALSLLNLIYAYDFKDDLGNEKENWLLYWENYQKSYDDWGKQFIELRLQRLSGKSSVSIYELNDITTSPYYKSLYRNIVLDALDKVEPTRNLRRLKIKPQLNTFIELKYLQDIDFRPNELLDVFDLLKVDNNKKLFNFLMAKSEAYPQQARVAFFVKMVETDWFNRYIREDGIDEKVYTQLQRYIDRYSLSRKTPESEQQRATLALARLSAAVEVTSLEGRLTMARNMKINNNVSVSDLAKFQEMALREAEYGEIPVILDNWRDLSPAIDYNVFHERFGLPVFDISNSQTRSDLKRNFQKKDTMQLYQDYLRDFGVDFERGSGRLDFEKIYDLLKYGVVYPFVGDNTPRNFYVNGLIRVLELHFNDDLNFPEYFEQDKGPNGRSIRAYSWLQYLENNNVVKGRQTFPPSFAFAYLQSPNS